MDPDFKQFLDEYGIPSPEEDLVDDAPPDPVDEDKLRAFHRQELDGPESEWVAFLISRYRAWNEADVRLVMQGATTVQKAAPSIASGLLEAVRQAAETLSREVKKYLGLEYVDLLAELPLFAPAGLRTDPLAPYRPELRRIICEEWDWPGKRDDPAYRAPEALAEALARAIGHHAPQLPFPPALLAVILVREGLDDFCSPEE